MLPLFISMTNKDEQLMVNDKEWRGTEEWKQAQVKDYLVK